MISLKHLPLCAACAQRLARELRCDADLSKAQVNLTEGHWAGTFSFSARAPAKAARTQLSMGRRHTGGHRCAGSCSMCSHCRSPGGMSEQRRGLGSLARCTLRSWDPPRQEDMELCGQLSCFQKHLFWSQLSLKKKGWVSFSCQWQTLQTFLGVCMWGAEGVLACASLPLPACPGCGSLLQLPTAREIGRLLSTGGRAGTGGNCVQLGFITRNNPEHQYRLRVTC